MTPLGERSASVGRIVFLTLLCMSIGAATVGFVAVFGVQSFRKEFDRIVETDMPQATIATRLNAEISGLTSQVGLLLTAKSEVALDTIRIQTGDQLDAINRQKERLRAFDMRSGDYEEIDTTLTALIANLDALSALSSRRLRAQQALETLGQQFRSLAAEHPALPALLDWLHRIETASRLRELESTHHPLEQIIDAPDIQRVGDDIRALRRSILEIETIIEGRLNQHKQVSARLTDATRFMSTRLISEANSRSIAIQSLIRQNLYLILACFLIFATVGAYIYVYLDKHVVGRIQRLTHKMNAYDKLGANDPTVPNEITQLENSFTTLTEVIAEREKRLVALNTTATEARRDAERANTSKSTLLAAASHDLRQPVHAMGLLIGGIDRSTLSDKTRQTVEQLSDLTQETVRLFNSILDLSKLEAGTFTALQVPVDLQAVFKRVAAEFGPRAKNAGAMLKVRVPKRNLFVNADEDALYRIISNLVVNAIEHANDGVITVFFDASDTGCIVYVSDNGPGLNLDVEPRSHEGASSDMMGYGLGLSISFALATAMQTKLTFTLPESGGTCFALALNQSPSAIELTTTSDSPNITQTPMRGLNIIFLEDNIDIQSATCDGLTSLGCTVQACTTQQQAAKAIQNANEPFVLISDVNLGRGHVADDIITEALEHHPLLIAVIVTTASRLSTPHLWATYDTVHFLEKPFSISRLASLLRHIARPK